MKIQTKHAKIIVFLLAAAFAVPDFAEDATPAKPADKPDEAKMMAMMMELAKPGENHKLLEGFVGKWSYTGKFWMSPDPSAPPTEYHGKTVTKPIMGGRYVQSDVSGKMQMPGPDGKLTDMEFKGLSIDGYDNVKKLFVSSWVDNMGTGIMNLQGAYDPSTKTVTYTSEYEAMPGMKTKVRQLLKLIDNDHHTLEFYENRGDSEVKTMEISYTRDS